MVKKILATDDGRKRSVMLGYAENLPDALSALENIVALGVVAGTALALSGMLLMGIDQSFWTGVGFVTGGFALMFAAFRAHEGLKLKWELYSLPYSLDNSEMPAVTEAIQKVLEEFPA